MWKIVCYVKTKLYGLSPRANYTDRATAACRRSYCQRFADRGCHGQRDGFLRPYSRFYRPESLLFYQVAPQLYSRGWVDPVPDPLLLRKSGSAGNRTQTSGSVARNSEHGWYLSRCRVLCPLCSLEIPKPLPELNVLWVRLPAIVCRHSPAISVTTNESDA
jgi:hypothetical protein